MIKEITQSINIVELRQLLFDIMEMQPHVHIRIRQTGKEWDEHFMKVVYVGEESLVLHDEPNSRMVFVQGLHSLSQLELDVRFQHFDPLISYDVTA